MSQSRMIRGIVGAAFLGAALLLSMAGAAPEPPPHSDTVQRVRTVVTEAATEGRRLRFSGVTRAARRAELSFSVPGRLERRPVEVGGRVAAGQVLARLDTVELANAVDAAAASLAEIEARRSQAERERQRVGRLFALEAATAEELEQAQAAGDALEAGRTSAEVRLREARRRLAEGTLRAPYTGTVTDVLAEPGEYLAAGHPVVALSGDGEVEVEVGVPEPLLPHLSPGHPIAVSLPLLRGAEASGRVRSVGRAAVGAGRLFPLVVALGDGPGLVPGLTAELWVEEPAAGGFAVPVDAVLNPGGSDPAIFLVRGGVAVRVPVTLERLESDRAVVRGDLAPGERVVVAGLSGLVDGDRVEVEP